MRRQPRMIALSIAAIVALSALSVANTLTTMTIAATIEIVQGRRAHMVISRATRTV